MMGKRCSMRNDSVSALGVLLAAVLLSAPAWGCSRGTTGGFGPVWTGTSWGYYGSPPPGELVPGAPFLSSGSVVLYDSSGQLLSAQGVRAPELADGRFYPRSIAVDGTIWGQVICSDWDEPLEPLCGRAVRIDSEGEVLEVAEEGEGEPWRSTASLRVGVLGGASTDPPEPYRLRLQWGSAEPQLLSSPLEGLERSLGPPAWAANEAGELAVLWLGDAEAHLQRFDANGRPQLNRVYPRSHRAGLSDGPDSPLKLAGGRMILASDGSLILGSWSINPDCSPRHASSFVVLDRAGDLRAWVGRGEVSAMAISDDDVLAVQRRGHRETELYDLDGERLGAFEPPQPWRDEFESRRAAAAQVGPNSDPSEWVRHYFFVSVGPSSAGDGPAVDDWIVGAWPANAGELPPGLLRRLAPRLCNREREFAPAELLEAFRAETNYSERLEYFEALRVCFDEPPDDVVEVARFAVGRKDPYSSQGARKALRQWRLLPEQSPSDSRGRSETPAWGIDEAWELILSSNVPRGTHGRPTGGARSVLLSNLSQIEQRVLDTVGIGGAKADRVIDLLYDILVASPSGNWGVSERDVMERWVAAWTDAEAMEIVRLRDLLAVLVAVDEAAFERLVSASIENGETGFWLGMALSGARNPPHPRPPSWSLSPNLPGLARRHLSEASVQLPERCRESGTYVSCRGGGATAPVAALAALAGDGAVDAVWSRSRSDADEDLWLVLQVAVARSELLEDEHWRWLLRQRYLEKREILRVVTQLLRSHPGPSQPSWELVAELYRRLGVLHGRDTVLRLADLQRPQNGPRGRRTPLVDLVEPEDLQGQLETERDLQRWLPLLAEVGAWPQIAGRVEEMLNGHAGVQAALALAPLGDRRALDVLLDRGITEWNDPAPGLRHFGQEAIDRLVVLAHHDDEWVRSRARAALRELGMPRSLRTVLVDEARERLAAGATPELESWLLLADIDEQVALDFVQRLAERQLLRIGHKSLSPELHTRVIGLIARMAEKGSAVRAEALGLLKGWSNRSAIAKEALHRVRG